MTSGNAIKVYTLSSGEELPTPENLEITSTEIITTSKDDFYQMEDDFDVDFNNDGIVGKDDKLAVSSAVGDVTAQYDYLQNAFYLDSVSGSSFELQQKNGKQFKAAKGKNELAGAGLVGDDFKVVYKNSKNNILTVYDMTEVLDANDAATGDMKQVGKTTKVQTKKLADYLQYETDFGIDFNGDGYVGKDIGGATDADGNKIGDGSFDNNDLILGEDDGQIEQYSDLAGGIYAKAVDSALDATAITVDDEAYADGAYKKLKGWSVLGLDTTFADDGSVNNIGIFNKGKSYQMVSFGSDWNFDTSKDSTDSITKYSKKKLEGSNLEDLFVQDLNNDSFI